MNKQQLIKEIHKIVGEHCFDRLQVQDGWFNWLWLEKQINELDEPSREQCKNIAHDAQFICSVCNCGINAPNRCLVDLSNEGDNGDYAYNANYCPNCGSKIKREKKDE